MQFYFTENLINFNSRRVIVNSREKLVREMRGAFSYGDTGVGGGREGRLFSFVGPRTRHKVPSFPCTK